MSGRRQRILVLALVAAGAGTLGSAAGGLARTDHQLATAAAEVRLAAEEKHGDCPERDAAPDAGVRPEL